jgi:hypothetical protein
MARWTAHLGAVTPEHEGFFVALALAGLPRGRALARIQLGDPVELVQVGCSCGWRSARFRAPPGARWSSTTLLPKELPAGFLEMPRGNLPATVVLARAFEQIHRFEDQALALWRDHTRHHILGELADGTRIDALEVVP